MSCIINDKCFEYPHWGSWGLIAHGTFPPNSQEMQEHSDRFQKSTKLSLLGLVTDLMCQQTGSSLAQVIVYYLFSAMKISETIWLVDSPHKGPVMWKAFLYDAIYITQFSHHRIRQWFVFVSCRPFAIPITIDNKSGPRFNIKMSSYQYRKSHCGDKTIFSTMGFPTLLRRHLYIELDTRFLCTDFRLNSWEIKDIVLDLLFGCCLGAHQRDSEANKLSLRSK